MGNRPWPGPQIHLEWRRVETLPQEDHDLWLITMSDLMTLLLIFFLVWFIVKTHKRLDLTYSLNVKNSEVSSVRPLPKLREVPPYSTRFTVSPATPGQDETVVELLEGSGFAPGSARLSPQGRAMLRSMAPHLLKNIGRWQITIVGHTDSTPVAGSRWDSNLSLSMARATAVWRYLVELGIPPTRMELKALGSLHPQVPNDTPEHRRLNRRVEILLRPVELPPHLPQA